MSEEICIKENEVEVVDSVVVESVPLVEEKPVVDERPLVERLKGCKSRKAARESIAGYCEENGIKPTEFKLGREEMLVIDALR
jgi:hypothetical protein